MTFPGAEDSRANQVDPVRAMYQEIGSEYCSCPSCGLKQTLKPQCVRCHQSLGAKRAQPQRIHRLRLQHGFYFCALLIVMLIGGFAYQNYLEQPKAEESQAIQFLSQSSDLAQRLGTPFQVAPKASAQHLLTPSRKILRFRVQSAQGDFDVDVEMVKEGDFWNIEQTKIQSLEASKASAQASAREA